MFHKTQVCLMDQSRGLQRVALAFATQVCRGKLAKFPIHERYEFRLGSLVTTPPFREETRHFMGN
jgi:hypothetical protein